MKNIWHIFTRDIKNISSNWVVAVIISGLIFLPSLYAWFNIEASWDPYSQTNQIPVGVVNEDIGADIRGEPIHVGDDLMETLKDNDSFDWQFVDYEEAMEKVEYGDFFSVIVIPDNFSASLATVIDTKPQKANVEYYVNEKINAIAPKITEKGASVIVDQVSSNFIATVNGVIFEAFNEIGLELQQELPDIQQIETYIFDVEEALPEIKDLLDRSLGDANDAQALLRKAEDFIPEVEETINQGLKIINETTTMINDGEKRLNDAMPEINQNLDEVQRVTTEINEFMKQIDVAEIDYKFKDELNANINQNITESLEKIETVEAIVKLLTDASEEGLEQKDELLSNLERLKANMKEKEQTDDVVENIASIDAAIDLIVEASSPSKDKTNDLLDNLETLKAGINDINKSVDQVDEILTEREGDVEAFITTLQSKTQTVSNRVDEFIIEYRDEIQPKVVQEMDNAKVVLANAGSALKDIKATIPEVERLLANTGSGLDDGEDILVSVLNEYPFVNSKATHLADRVRSIKEVTDIDEIIELLQNDPEADRDFFAQPVELTENRVFPIENYGAGMTPFFTVLAIWVGAVLLISLLSVNVIGQDEFTPREVYFGRFLTYLTIGILQALIVTVGDVTLLSVPVSSEFWFIVFGLFISIIFVTIVYTTVSVFGDVGKAIVIVMLVLQIAGSGGTYPVVLLPKFFQTISPMLPFTYAIDLMREALGGIVWERAIKDIIALSLFAVGFIVAGIFLKEGFNKRSEKLMAQSKESGLFG